MSRGAEGKKMDYPTIEANFEEDPDSPRYPPPSKNSYTHPRSQFVQPPPPQSPYSHPRSQFVQPPVPPSHNLYADLDMKYVQQPRLAPQKPHSEPHVQYVQPPLSKNRAQFVQSAPPQNPHAGPKVQRPPGNPHAEPHAKYTQPPPQNPHAKGQAAHAQALGEPEVQYVQPPLNSDAQVIYVQPPPQGANSFPALWVSGLYSCAQHPCNCCLTLWCPCVIFGRIAEIVDEDSPSCIVSGGIHGVLCLVGIAASVFIGWPLLTGFGWCYGCSYRTKMRAKYHLAETPCSDCGVHCCCEPCALCQEYKELKHRGFDPALGWKKNAGNQKQRATTPPANQAMAK